MTRFDQIHFNPRLLTEHRFVELMLRTLGKDHLIPQIIADQKRLHPERPILTFHVAESVVGMPIRLRPIWVSHAKSRLRPDGTTRTSGGRVIREQIAHMILDFDTSAIGKHYRHLQRVLRDPGDRRPTGAVFHHAKVPGGWIVHDGEDAGVLDDLVDVAVR